MDIFGKGKKKGEEASPISSVDKTDVGTLKDAKDELDITDVKVPSIPGTEARVILVATENTEHGHKKGDEFSVAEPNAKKIIATGKYKLKN